LCRSSTFRLLLTFGGKMSLSSTMTMSICQNRTLQALASVCLDQPFKRRPMSLSLLVTLCVGNMLWLFSSCHFGLES
jgi:hypothetical protein